MKIDINPNRNGSFKIDIRGQYKNINKAYESIKKELEKHDIIYIKETNDFYHRRLNRQYVMPPETIKYCLEKNYILVFKAQEPFFYSEKYAKYHIR